MNAAYLYAQLEKADEIFNNRMQTWDVYYKQLKELENRGYIQLPFIPDKCKHNAHMFYIKTKDLFERIRLISFLNSKEILSVFYYVPLYSALVGKYGKFCGMDIYMTKESERLLRLPLYYDIKKEDIGIIIDSILTFYYVMEISN